VNNPSGQPDSDLDSSDNSSLFLLLKIQARESGGKGGGMTALGKDWMDAGKDGK
jgi:hypothetical protein